MEPFHSVYLPQSSSLSTVRIKLPGKTESSPGLVLVPRSQDAGSYPQGIIICGYSMIKETCENPVQLLGDSEFGVPFFPERERSMILLGTGSTGLQNLIGFNSKSTYKASHCSRDCVYRAG